MRNRTRRGQHTTEYALLFGTIGVAVSLMLVQVRRAYDAKILSGVATLDQVVGNFNVGGIDVKFGNNKQQYESYATRSNGDIYQESADRTTFQRGNMFTEKISDMVVRKAGSVQEQLVSGNNIMNRRDGAWR